MTTLPDGQLAAEITLTPEQTRQIIILLIDVHGLLDYYLHLADADPELTAPAEAYLRETASGHTLATVIEALDNLATQLTRATRDAVLHSCPPPPRHAADF
jgi:hypothetical protein